MATIINDHMMKTAIMFVADQKDVIGIISMARGFVMSNAAHARKIHPASDVTARRLKVTDSVFTRLIKLDSLLFILKNKRSRHLSAKKNQGDFSFEDLRRKLWRLTLQTLQCLESFLKLVRHKSGGIKPSRQIPSLFPLARFSWLERNSFGSLLVSAHPWLTSQLLRFSFFSRQFACLGFLSVFCRSEISVQ